MIKIRNLYFFYDGYCALNNINLDIEKGSVVGLVGANGAGKTTLFKTILGLETPLIGEIEIDGMSTTLHPRKVLQHTAYVSDKFILFDELTVLQSLIYQAGLHGISFDEAIPISSYYLEQLGLANHANQLTKNLSRGQKQRVAIALALIHSPQLLLLDEPLSGLDPIQRGVINQTLKMLGESGVTILVSSHILGELDEYCTHLLMIKEGVITNYEALKESGSEVTYLVEVRSPFSIDSFLERLKKEVEREALFPLEKLQVDYSHLTAETKEFNLKFKSEESLAVEELNHLIRAIQRADSAIVTVTKKRQNLSELYFEKVMEGGMS